MIALEEIVAQLTGSIVDYGAKGDGVTDDTAAIQAAVDNSTLVMVLTEIVDALRGRIHALQFGNLEDEGLVDEKIREVLAKLDSQK